MAGMITHEYRLFAIKQFIGALSESMPTNTYMFIGRPQQWSVDVQPDNVYDNQQTISAIWDDMMSLKRMQSSDTTIAIKRYDWTSGRVYDEYRHNYSLTNPAYSGATSLYDSVFYVMNSEYNVYKCISNNNNALSTVQPTGTSLTIFDTEDGYRWKYMYTVSPSDIQKFATANHIPVKTNDTVKSVAVDGAINHTRVVYGGTGITTTPDITLFGDGDGAVLIPIMIGGEVKKIVMNSVGSGYRTAIATATSGVVIEPIIEPVGGHGYDAESELGARYLIVNINLIYAEEGGNFTTSNEYRRVGIVTNPLIYGTTTPATASDLSSMHSIVLSSGVTGTYEPDELITGSTSGAIGYVVDYQPVTRTIRYIQTSAQNYKSFVAGETVVGGTSGAAGTINTVVNPDITKNSGNIVYSETRPPIRRTIDQIDSISLIIKF